MGKTADLYRFSITFYFVLCVTSLTNAQVSRAKGLVFNTAKYKATVKLRDLDKRGGTMRELPIRLSLRPYCPTPQDQGAEPSCTAWAMAYGAVTIQQAIQRQVTNAMDIDKIACSKSFVFNQLIEKDKNYTPSVEETFSFLKTNGTCLAATFRNDVPPTKKPDDLAITEAQNYRLADATEVFDPDLAIPMATQIRRLKRLLADSVPVIVGMRLPYIFANLTGKKFVYNRKDALDSSAHALCLIGYDDIDSTFELMNSWGTTWGDKGFVRVPYKDVIALLCCAYRLTPQFYMDKKDAILRGAIVLRSSTGYNEQKIPQFEEVRVQYDSIQKQYQTLQTEWQVGQGFQLALRQLPTDWWVYVFNINTEGEVSVFFNSQIKGKLVEKVIPNDEVKFELEERGTEWLYILCSKGPLSNSFDFLQKTRKVNAQTIHGQIVKAMNEKSTSNALLTAKRMGFNFPKNSDGGAALVVLKIDVK
jgi:hypothetical protein